MAKTIRATNMALAFVEATAKAANKVGLAKAPWTARHVAEAVGRDHPVGEIVEINEISISGRPAYEIDARLNRNMPGLIPQLGSMDSARHRKIVRDLSKLIDRMMS